MHTWPLPSSQHPQTHSLESVSTGHTGTSLGVCVSTIVLPNTMCFVFVVTAHKLASQAHSPRRATISDTLVQQMVVMRQCETKRCDMKFKPRDLEAGNKFRQHECTLCVRVRACDVGSNTCRAKAWAFSLARFATQKNFVYLTPAQA